MKLVEILYNNIKHWPHDAVLAYQSAIDSEIYFLGCYNVHESVKKIVVDEFADIRGMRGKVRKEEFVVYKRIKDDIKNHNSKDENWLINRIALGLKEDFDIDSPELARKMYDSGWRK